MAVYWSLYLIPALLAIRRARLPGITWWILFGAVTLLIGLRYQVGADWWSYNEYLARASAYSLSELLGLRDPGYYLLNWLSDRLVGSVWLVNLISAAIFTAGLVRFCRSLPDPALAFAVAVPYMTIVLAMGYTRQAVAFGLLLWALVELKNRRRLHFVFVIALAATFHMSAVVLLPLAAVSATRNRVWTMVWVGAAAGALYLLFLAEQVDTLWQTYVESEYAFASAGGPIRVAMNFLPAVVFIALRRRFEMDAEQSKLWFWVAVLSIVCLPLVFQAPTAVDRVALYFMPIQLVVWSHFASLFHPSQRHLIRIGVLLVYGLVLFVWLNYAHNAIGWLPYQFWPLVRY